MIARDCTIVKMSTLGQPVDPKGVSSDILRHPGITLATAILPLGAFNPVESTFRFLFSVSPEFCTTSMYNTKMIIFDSTHHQTPIVTTGTRLWQT